MSSKVEPVDIAELTSKVLDLPTETKQKQASKTLLHEIKGFITDFYKNYRDSKSDYGAWQKRRF